jgi:hypothetical protein
LDSDGNPLPDYDVTAINGKIRELLSLFEKSAYVGYTATPFANIFIDPQESSEKYGDDLFPRNFIISLPPPSNYIGPAKVFGFDGSVDAGIPAEAGLGIVLTINDTANWLPIPHKNHTRPTGPLPASLISAIHDFIISCAARRARGQRNVHNSMLVHVTRYNVTQAAVADQIQEVLSSIQNRVRYGDGARTPTILDEIKKRWTTEFEPKYGSIKATIDDPMMTPLDWTQVEAEIKDAAALIEVRKINGTAGDTLDYHLHSEGISVIAVGGDKLSRGLTIEGLSVSSAWVEENPDDLGQGYPGTRCRGLQTSRQSDQPCNRQVFIRLDSKDSSFQTPLRNKSRPPHCGGRAEGRWRQKINGGIPAETHRGIYSRADNCPRVLTEGGRARTPFRGCAGKRNLQGFRS